MRMMRMFQSGKNLMAPLAALLGAVALSAVALQAAGCGEESKTSATSAVTVDTGGRLQVAETYFDFGAVPVGQQVQHEFELKNTGTGPLNLGQMSVKRLEGC